MRQADDVSDTDQARVDSACGRGAAPIEPVRLGLEDQFRFACHRALSCWNACCHGADVTLTPGDILRMSTRLNLRPAEFLAHYTVPALHDASGMPIVKLKMGGEDGTGPCPLMVSDGCSVYGDRPVTCRYYPLGSASTKFKGSEQKQNFQFLVCEPHCRGHEESTSQTVSEFCRNQAVEAYDRVNRGWVDILMKSTSWRTIGGPMGKEPSSQTRQMFFMVSTDVDRFRRFILESRFLEIYEVSDATIDQIKTDDEQLLQFGFDWLKNVLFNEPTIAMRPAVLQRAVAAARTEMGAA